MKRPFAFSLLILLLSTSNVSARGDTIQLKKAYIFSRIQGDECATLLPKYPLLGEEVTLYLIVEAKGTEGEIFLGTCERIILRGSKIKVHPPDQQLKEININWFKLEPKGHKYINFLGERDAKKGPFAKVGYDEIPLREWGSCWQHKADVTSTRFEIPIPGTGTMRFKVEVRMGKTVLTSHGAEADYVDEKGLYYGGLSDDVCRITYRLDNSYLGYLTELFNCPFILGSRGFTLETSETMRLVGTDCSTHACYGKIRQGYQIDLATPWKIKEYLDELVRIFGCDDKGHFLDSEGKPIPLAGYGIKPGDIVHFGDQVDIFWEDRAPLEIFDKNDVVLQTYEKEPILIPIEKSGFMGVPFFVAKWKDLLSTTPLTRIEGKIPGATIDLRYASEGNAFKMKFYECSNALIDKKTLSKLIRAAELLKEKGYRLIIWDAYRPARVQYEMWRKKPFPIFVANPHRGSAHNRGAAIDVSLANMDGEELEMGTDFDDFSDKASHNYKDLPSDVRERRIILQVIMAACGLSSYNREWWHYTDRQRLSNPVMDIDLCDFR